MLGQYITSTLAQSFIQYFHLFEEMHNEHSLFLSGTALFGQKQEELHESIDLQLINEAKLEEQTCWRTNLMIDSEFKRVQQRSETFKKRTSFEENLVNDHLIIMKRILEMTGLKVKKISLPSNDKMFSDIRESKQIELIDSNTYLSEEQKWEIKQAIFSSQENFSILLRLSSLFQENREELAYLLCKIIHYTSTSIDCKPNQRVKANLHEIMSHHQLKIIDAILNQEFIKIINPDFFSSVNEQPLMEIFNVWFYNILCIKNGVYDYDDEEEMVDEIEEDNFFD